MFRPVIRRSSRYASAALAVGIACLLAFGPGRGCADQTWELPTSAETDLPQRAPPPTGLTAEAVRLENGEGIARNYALAADLYCRAARNGDSDAAYRLGWMYANGRGLMRDDRLATGLFRYAAERSHDYAKRMLVHVNTAEAVLPACMIPPAVIAEESRALPLAWTATPERMRIVDLVKQQAPAYGIEPRLALAIIQAESGFQVSAKSNMNAQGLMQLIPETAERFGVRKIMDPKENIRGGPRVSALAAVVLRRRRRARHGRLQRRRARGRALPRRSALRGDPPVRGPRHRRLRQDDARLQPGRRRPVAAGGVATDAAGVGGREGNPMRRIRQGKRVGAVRDARGAAGRPSSSGIGADGIGVGGIGAGMITAARFAAAGSAAVRTAAHCAAAVPMAAIRIATVQIATVRIATVRIATVRTAAVRIAAVRIAASRAVAAGLGAVAVAAAGGAHAADEPGLPAAIDRIRPSIVAVGTSEPTRNPSYQFRGTGFVVGDGTLVATNSHVVPAAVDTSSREVLSVAIPQPGGDAVVREATVVARDTEHDLALLRVNGPPMPAVRLGDSSHVREGQSFAFTGFPLGGAIGLFATTHHALVSAITPIALPQPTSRSLDAALVRRLRTERFAIFQLDATAYPGNSGSPLFAVDGGDVIAILNMVFVKGGKETALSQPSGISYAIPSLYLARLVESLKGEPRP